MKKNKIKNVECPYCHRPAVLRSAAEIYGAKAHRSEMVYACSGYPWCDAYVGVHSHSKEPMGTLANSELRRQRARAHQVFDQLWQTGPFTRKGAYQLLRLRFGLTKEEAHIGMFDGDMCEQTILFAEKIMSGQLMKGA